MARPRAIILRAAGTNCDLETEHAWSLAGAVPERVHIRSLAERPAGLMEYQILTLPGGFSYGDDISAGRIFAAQLERLLAGSVGEFIAAGRLVLGICNGLQILVKAGFLPGPYAAGSPRVCTIAGNEPPGFQDRWVCLEAGSRPCAFLEPGRRYEMPIAHGEGRVVFSSEQHLKRVLESGQAVLRYVPAGPAAGPAFEPYNPNGSQGDIAGLCDETGRVLGLMPHPDRFVVATQHPSWTSRPGREEGDGLAFFAQAVRYFT